MNPHSPKHIRAFLKSTGATAPQIVAAYARSIAGVEDCLARARKHKSGRYNGLTAQEWETQLADYRLKAGAVFAS